MYFRLPALDYRSGPYAMRFLIFLLKCNYGRLCGQIMWRIPMHLVVEVGSVSQNKCCDLKDLIEHIIFHIDVVAIGGILMEIDIRQHFC